jgi:hypothetical protein
MRAGMADSVPNGQASAGVHLLYSKRINAMRLQGFIFTAGLALTAGLSAPAFAQQSGGPAQSGVMDPKLTTAPAGAPGTEETPSSTTGENARMQGTTMQSRIRTQPGQSNYPDAASGTQQSGTTDSTTSPH